MKKIFNRVAANSYNPHQAASFDETSVFIHSPWLKWKRGPFGFIVEFLFVRRYHIAFGSNWMTSIN